MRLLVRLLLDQDEAATAVEYAVMLALILLAVIGSVAALGSQNGGLWGNNSTAMQAVGFS